MSALHAQHILDHTSCRAVYIQLGKDIAPHTASVNSLFSFAGITPSKTVSRQQISIQPVIHVAVGTHASTSGRVSHQFSIGRGLTHATNAIFGQRTTDRIPNIAEFAVRGI